MILATILRNFKCYKGYNIIPFSQDTNNSLNIIIGNNGVGKSAILEGLDTLFNDAPWIVNNETRSRDDSVAGALFLLPKSVVDSIFETREQDIINAASSYIWSVDFDTNPTIKSFEPLKAIRDAKKTSMSGTHYLLVIGRAKKERKLNFLSFDSLIRNTLDPKPTAESIDKVLQNVLALHTYIYIPVETPVSSFVTLQNQSMQTLMDKSIKATISESLNERRITRTVGTKQKKISLLQIINENLEKYVSEVEKDIQKEDSGYSYRPGYNKSSKLTANHVTEAIIEAYYAKRVFKKDGKLIDNLSSGEKRVILLDIISAFIKKNNPDRELIVAIDEPENSLHISKSYDQFAKINKIALDYNHQIFVTTHWYGSLPCLSKGGLIHIDDKSQSRCYELSNYFEERRQLPDDIQLKGYFDLSSSLLYSFRNSVRTMLLVEGKEDKIYIEYYLNDVDLNIIPLGGCSNIKKVYQYLYTPLDNEELFDGTRKNRIICLIDTDNLCTDMPVKSDTKTQVLKLRRLQQADGQESELVTNENPNKYPTEIEDVLESKQFYDSLNGVIATYGTDAEKEVWAAYEYNSACHSSRIKGDDSLIKGTTLGRNISDDKKVICSFIDLHKRDIAEKYVSYPKPSTMPKWLTLLKDMAYSK